MATTVATDVVMESFDFSSFLQMNTGLKTAFPIIADEGPIKITSLSKTNIPIYGKYAKGNHIAALKTALKSGTHYGVRVTTEDARSSAVLVGLFVVNKGEESSPFLGIVPLFTRTIGEGPGPRFTRTIDEGLGPLSLSSGSSSSVGTSNSYYDPDYPVPTASRDVAPAYRNGGVPIDLSKFRPLDATKDYGWDFFQPYIPNSYKGESVPTFWLYEPLAVLYRNGPADDSGQLGVRIVSQNVAPISPIKGHVLLQGGNLPAGRYQYRRTPVTSQGEQSGLASSSYEVTLTQSDVDKGYRSIKLLWDQDDPAVRGTCIYRTTNGNSNPNYNTKGRIAELQRTRVTHVDDTYRVDGDDSPTVTTRSTISDNFTLEVYNNDSLVETIPFSFTTETEAHTASPIDEAVNMTSSVLLCKRFYEERITQYAGTSDRPPFILYSTPIAPLMGGYKGGTPTSDDLKRALEPFLNRDRYRISSIVDLGWADTATAYEFSLVEEQQRCHSILPVPYYQQSAPASVAYASSLPSGSRRSSIYTPWMYTREPDTGAKVLVPASAFACQAMLQSDLATTGGAGRSFAGPNRGVVDAIGVEDPEKYEFDDEARDLMASGLVNYFRRRPNLGMVLWEDWTLQRNLTSASFVNVSRLWDIIQNAINDYLEYKLKEPNDEYNTIDIISGLNLYLQGHVLNRNLSRFEVIADERAGNNDDTMSSGIRNVDVYLTPVLAVRRYRCRTILTRHGASYENLIQAM